MKILAINGGSSSFKCRLDEIQADPPSAPPPAAHGKRISTSSHGAIEQALRSVPGPVDMVGHRIVHGGPKYRTATRITLRSTPPSRPRLKSRPSIIDLSSKRSIAPVAFSLRHDTSRSLRRRLSRTLEPEAYVYPGPYDWLAQGIRRYGFHGVSFQYATRRATEFWAGSRV